MKTRYDTKATGHQFKEGDKVWFYNPTRRKGLSPKLQSHWDGPYTIFKDNKRRRNPGSESPHPWRQTKKAPSEPDNGGK
ncbi:hypothetical protein TNCV_404041 [Trichonephila clavipes]|nr:hypothetical protein TNCV_404041 [Trichonephila clavipes]